MTALVSLNEMLYHSVEILLCNIHIGFLQARRAIRAARIAELEAILKARHAVA